MSGTIIASFPEAGASRSFDCTLLDSLDAELPASSLRGTVYRKRSGIVRLCSR